MTPGGALILALLCLAVAACAGPQNLPDLRTIYGRAAQIQGPERRPLIVVPGTLGTKLVDSTTGAPVWGGSDGLSLDPAIARNLEILALPFGDGSAPMHTLHDEVRAAGVLRTVRALFLGVPVELQVYSGIERTLEAGGWQGVDEGTVAPGLNVFPFPYDWRRDLIDSVRELDTFVRRQQIAYAQITGRPPDSIRFDILAHSMGALITRYYLMYGVQDMPDTGGPPDLTWEGARYIGKAVLVAPPNAGSILAFENLVNGKTLGPLQPRFPAALLGSHFSTYALMPRNRHHTVHWAGSDEPVRDIYDADLWQKMRWGLANPDNYELLAAMMPDITDPAERWRRALAFQVEALARAKQFQVALDRPVDALPPDLDIHLVVGGSYSTPAGAAVNRDTGEVVIDRFEEGDGVVLRASSLLDERQGGSYRYGLDTPLRYTSTLFLPEEHVELTQSPVFGDNLLFWLIEGTRVGDGLRSAGLVTLPLAGGDAGDIGPPERHRQDR